MIISAGQLNQVLDAPGAGGHRWPRIVESVSRPQSVQTMPAEAQLGSQQVGDDPLVEAERDLPRTGFRSASRSRA
jgi:hypothetical protein